MKNVHKPLNRLERSALTQIGDPLFELFFVLGWRRNEIVQLILQNENDLTNHFIRFKKQKEPVFKDLTKYERKILKSTIQHHETIRLWQTRYQNGASPNRCLLGLGRGINLLFEHYSKKLNFRLTPHRLRATHASALARMGATGLQIQASLGHANLKTTEGYISLAEADILENRRLLYKFQTFEGMTFAEMRTEFLKQKRKIARLEHKIEQMKKETTFYQGKG